MSAPNKVHPVRKPPLLWRGCRKKCSLIIKGGDQSPVLSNGVHTIQSVRLDPELVTPSEEGERSPTQVKNRMVLGNSKVFPVLLGLCDGKPADRKLSQKALNSP